jgi:hypothetical protein
MGRSSTSTNLYLLDIPTGFQGTNSLSRHSLQQLAVLANARCVIYANEQYA